jgi:hypothetical protein
MPRASRGAPVGSDWARLTATKLLQGRRTVVQSPGVCVGGGGRYGETGVQAVGCVRIRMRGQAGEGKPAGGVRGQGRRQWGVSG